MDLLIWIIIIIVLVGGAIYFLRKKSGSTPKESKGAISDYSPPAPPMNPPENFSDDSPKNPPTDSM